MSFPLTRRLLLDDARARAAGALGATVRRVAAGIVAVWLGATQALAAGAGRPESSAANHADTNRLPPGIGHWIADLYNHSLWLYGLTVVVVMAGMGLVLGLLTDRLVAMLGVDLGRTARHE